MDTTQWAKGAVTFPGLCLHCNATALLRWEGKWGEAGTKEKGGVEHILALPRRRKTAAWWPQSGEGRGHGQGVAF